MSWLGVHLHYRLILLSKPHWFILLTFLCCCCCCGSLNSEYVEGERRFGSWATQMFHAKLEFICKSRRANGTVGLIYGVWTVYYIVPLSPPVPVRRFSQYSTFVCVWRQLSVRRFFLLLQHCRYGWLRGTGWRRATTERKWLGRFLS